MTVNHHVHDAAFRSDGAGESAAVLDVRVRFTPALPVVRLVGDLDLSSAHLVVEAIETLAVTTAPDASVVLDLGRVRFCDVAGLRGLEVASVVLAGFGKELVLYGVPETVARLISLTGVASRLTAR